MCVFLICIYSLLCRHFEAFSPRYLCSLFVFQITIHCSSRYAVDLFIPIHFFGCGGTLYVHVPFRRCLYSLLYLGLLCCRSSSCNPTHRKRRSPVCILHTILTPVQKGVVQDDDGSHGDVDAVVDGGSVGEDGSSQQSAVALVVQRQWRRRCW